MQKAIAVILIPIIIFSLIGCATSSSKHELPVTHPIPAVNLQEQHSKIPEYIIGRGDILEISVWQCKELEKDVKVRPDGKISFPLIGDVMAGGLTPTQLSKELKEKLAFYVKEPKVLVGVKELGERKVFILGEVARPGVYTFEHQVRIVEVISKAGGYTEDAVLASTKIIRGELKEENVISVDLAKLIKKGDMSQNIFVQEGDIVYLPRVFIANVNYVLRQILPSLYFIDTTAEVQRELSE